MAETGIVQGQNFPKGNPYGTTIAGRNIPPSVQRGRESGGFFGNGHAAPPFWRYQYASGIPWGAVQSPGGNDRGK